MERVLPVQQIHNKINFMIDPRIELLSSIQLISNYGELAPLIFKGEFEYKTSMLKHFEQYKEHRAVKIFEKLSVKGLNFDAPHNLMLYLSNPLEIRYIKQLDDYIVDRIALDGYYADKKDELRSELNNWVEALREYAIETKFNEFFKANHDFYNETLKTNIDMIGDISFVKQIESYYNMEKDNYNIIFTPVLRGNYGIDINLNNEEVVYAILGVGNVENEIPKFIDINKFKHLVWHEFSHPFINPITAEFKNDVDRYDELLIPIKDVMSEQAYENWEICVNEHLIRALTTRFHYIYDGKRAGDMALYEELKSGFSYVEALCNKLKEYEGNRDKFSNFKEFYPEIINAFNELKNSNLDENFYRVEFKGDSNEVVKDLESFIIVLSTNEEDKSAQDKFNEDIREFFESKGINVITDVQALEMDLKDKSLYIYGTIEGNLLLNKYKELLPFKFSNDKLIFNNEEYLGDDLALICTMPNFMDKYRGMNVYTGQKFSGVLNTKGNFIPFTDHIILNHRDVIKSGRYLI